MKKFPDNPEIYNPVQLLHQMIPGIQFTEEIISTTGKHLFGVNCELKDVKFSGQGNIYFYYINKQYIFSFVL